MPESIHLFDGDVSLVIDQEAVHLRAIDDHGDPVELSAEMCRKLAAKLNEIAEMIDT